VFIADSLAGAAYDSIFLWFTLPEWQRRLPGNGPLAQFGIRRQCRTFLRNILWRKTLQRRFAVGARVAFARHYVMPQT
jgi:hypothetical protein